MTQPTASPDTKSPASFSHSLDDLKTSESVLQMAKAAGASSAEAEINLGFGQNVSVRLNETETIEYNRDKGMSVSVYFGQQRGNASTSDLSPQALKETVEAACNIARYTAQDAFCGLADPELLAKNYPELELHHPGRFRSSRLLSSQRSVKPLRLLSINGLPIPKGPVFLHMKACLFMPTAWDSAAATPVRATGSAAR